MKGEAFRDLVACQDEQSIADYLQVTLRTVRRWKRGTADAPHSAVLALRLHLHCELGALHPDWEGFTLHAGKLHTPGVFKRPFSPEGILGMFFTVQEVRWSRKELKRLSAELTLQQSHAWALQKVKQVTVT